MVCVRMIDSTKEREPDFLAFQFFVVVLTRGGLGRYPQPPQAEEALIPLTVEAAAPSSRPFLFQI